MVVVSGGINTEELVTLYHLGSGEETPLSSMNRGRLNHACAVYQDAAGQQVLLITGGYSHSDGYSDLSTTEVAVYSTDYQLEWREVEGGKLPSPRWGLRATS